MPKVSVIMPAYNAGQYIAAAIESLLTQSFGDFELLIINDSSTDNTESVIIEYSKRDARVVLLQNARGKGIVGALNTGLKEARGKYIARADADDLNHPDRFRLQVDYLDSHPDIFLLGTGVEFFDDTGYLFNMAHPSSSVEIAWRFVSRITYCHGTLMCRRAVFEALGEYQKAEIEDFKYFSRAARRFRGSNLPQVLYKYRQWPKSRMFTFNEEIYRNHFEVALDNIRYYLGDDAIAEAFYRYQYQHQLHWRDLIKIMKANRRILARIFADYGMSAHAREARRLRLVVARSYPEAIVWHNFSAVRPIYRKLKHYLRF
ncbi:MAG: glycosyltransferase family 2 protein [Patescibacteria group bacterium]